MQSAQHEHDDHNSDADDEERRNNETSSDRGSRRAHRMPWGVIVLGGVVAFILTVAMVVELSSSHVSLGSYSSMTETGTRRMQQQQDGDSTESVVSLLSTLDNLRDRVRKDSMSEKDRQKFLAVISRTQALIRDKVANDQAEKESQAPEEPEIEDRETVQTCYIQRDESEICVYSNLCFDGQNLVALVDDKETRERRQETQQTAPFGSSSSEEQCFDPRYQEPSCAEYSQCYPHAKQHRIYTLPFEARDPTIDHPLLFGYRLMGPNGGGYKWLKAHPDTVLGRNGRDNVRCKAPLKDKTAHVTIDETAPGCDTKSSTSVEWLDGSVWWVHLDNGDLADESQFASKILPLFDAMRSNRTRKGVQAPNPYQVKLGKGSYLWPQFENTTRNGMLARMIQGEQFDLKEEPEDSAEGRYKYSNAEKQRLLKEARSKTQSNREDHEQEGMIKSRYHGRRMVQYVDDHTTDPLYQINSRYGQVVMGTQWSMPEQAYVAITGPGTKDVSNSLRNRSDLPSFNEGILRLSTQENSKYLFPRDFSRYSSSKLLCSRTGVVSGKKPAMFTGRADAWMFREYAYKFARSSRLSHPHHPPRRVTLLVDKRSHRKIYNFDEVKAKAKSFGLPLSVIEDIHASGFKGQIRQMAETGILIAPHGAPLTSLMFLPQHAVVIELFPYMLRSTIYARLSQLLNLYYIPVTAVSKPPYNPRFTDVHHNLLYNDPFVSECERVNRSVFDAHMVASCMRAAVHYSVNVPLDKLGDALKEAVDLAASFSMDHLEWQEVAKRKHGLTPPSRGVPKRMSKPIVASSRLRQLGKLWIRDPTSG